MDDNKVEPLEEKENFNKTVSNRLEIIRNRKAELIVQLYALQQEETFLSNI